MAAIRPRGRAMLVYASAQVLAEARPIVGDGVVVEQQVAVAIQAGLRRSIEGVEISLRDDERLARPLGAPWVAVVARGRGRLVRNRDRSCWEIRRVVPVEAAEEARPRSAVSADSAEFVTGGSGAGVARRPSVSALNPGFAREKAGGD